MGFPHFSEITYKSVSRSETDIRINSNILSTSSFFQKMFRRGHGVSEGTWNIIASGAWEKKNLIELTTKIGGPI